MGHPECPDLGQMCTLRRMGYCDWQPKQKNNMFQKGCLEWEAVIKHKRRNLTFQKWRKDFFRQLTTLTGEVKNFFRVLTSLVRVVG